jgi:hypothetical protein
VEISRRRGMWRYRKPKMTPVVMMNIIKIQKTDTILFLFRMMLSKKTDRTKMEKIRNRKTKVSTIPKKTSDIFSLGRVF